MKRMISLLLRLGSCSVLAGRASRRAFLWWSSSASCSAVCSRKTACIYPCRSAALRRASPRTRSTVFAAMPESTGISSCGCCRPRSSASSSARLPPTRGLNTLGELFCLMTAEAAEISYNATLSLILEALLNAVCETFAVSDEQMQAFTNAFISHLPDYLRVSLGVPATFQAA